ncbi:MAG: hypothetical protein WD673_09730 [Alphaproteobacteria bacterium]
MTTPVASSNLTAASDLVAAMRRELGRDADADLSPLLGVVEAACQSIGALPRDEARALLPRVVALLDEVEALERELDAVRDKTKRQLSGLAQHRQADSAYRGGPRRR